MQDLKHSRQDVPLSYIPSLVAATINYWCSSNECKTFKTEIDIRRSNVPWTMPGSRQHSKISGESGCPHCEDEETGLERLSHVTDNTQQMTESGLALELEALCTLPCVCPNVCAPGRLGGCHTMNSSLTVGEEGCRNLLHIKKYFFLKLKGKCIVKKVIWERERKCALLYVVGHGGPASVFSRWRGLLHEWHWTAKIACVFFCLSALLGCSFISLPKCCPLPLIRWSCVP